MSILCKECGGQGYCTAEAPGEVGVVFAPCSCGNKLREILAAVFRAGYDFARENPDELMLGAAFLLSSSRALSTCIAHIAFEEERCST